MDKMDYIVPADSPTTTTPTESCGNCEVGKTAPAKAPLRSRNGCQTCRKRKVKCDEKKPICTHCSNLGQSCDYSNQLQWKEPKFTKNKNVKADVLAVRGNACWDPPSPRHFNLSLPPTPTQQSIPPLAAAVTDEGREWIADKYDKMGNCIYNYSPRYFDSLVAHNCYSGWPSEIGAGAGGMNVSSVAAGPQLAQEFNNCGDVIGGVGMQEQIHLQLLQQQEQTRQQLQQQQYSKPPHRETKRRKSNATALALGGDPITQQRPQLQAPILAPAAACQTQQYTSSTPISATSTALTTGATQPTAMSMHAISAELPIPSASNKSAPTSTATSKYHHPRNTATAGPAPPRPIKSKRKDKSGTSSPNDGRSSSNSGHSSGSATSGSGGGSSGGSSFALSTSSASTSKSAKSGNNKKTLGASKSSSSSSAAAASAAKASNKDPYAGSALAEMLGLQ